MSLGSTKYLWILGISAAIAACTPQSRSLHVMSSPQPEGIEAGKMVVEGNPATVVLSNVGALTQALSKYAPVADHGNLGHRIQHIRDANLDPMESVPGLTGVGGIIGHAFLNLAENGVQAGNFNSRVRVVTTVSGQILDYSYNDADGSGSIEAITYVTRSIVTPGAGVPPSDTVAYKYVVDVEPGGFVVHSHSGNASNPFPGTLGFNQEMLDRIASLGFMYKLWAKGTQIVVTDVWVDDEFEWGNPPTWEHVDPSDPKYARLYQTDAESCIDMMFVDYPPQTLGGMGPPFYCLGRCGDPLLINTR